LEVAEVKISLLFEDSGVENPKYKRIKKINK